MSGMCKKRIALIATLAAFVFRRIRGDRLCNPRPEHGLRFQTPSMVWDEAIPLGNGLFGALVWGDGAP